MSFGSTMDFTKDTPSLLSLIASIVFYYSIGMENYICWLVNEILEVGRALSQKQWELGHTSANYTILNQHVFSFIIYFKVYQMCLLSQCSVLNVVLNKVAPFLALNLYCQLISSMSETYIKVCSISFSILSHCGLPYSHLPSNIFD